MKRPSRALTIGLVICLTLWPVLASGQRIVLFRPKTPDPALLQAFGRLQGELAVHAFEVIVVDADDDTPSPADLAKAAEQAFAVGTISLLRSQGLASADVWISDRVTGKTSMRTIATAGRSEASSVLAIRAVDLLRASLREFGPGEPPPSDVVGAHPERSPKHVREWAAATTTRQHWSVNAGAVVQSTLSPLGNGYGPAVGLGYDASERLGFRLGFEGPLWGAKVSRQGSSLTLRNEQLFAGLGYRVVSRKGWAVELSVDLGAHHLQVQGTAAPPYVGRSNAAWTALAAGGLGFELWLTPAAALVLRGRAVFLAPRPVLRLETTEFPYGQPALQAGSSLRVCF
jgi:hypothetical protein